MKKTLLAVCALLVFVLAFLGVQRLLVPKYQTALIEGSLIGEYYSETTGHDVLFIGDCEVYENISPVALWQSHGITSFVRGSASQTVWQSYYLLEEMLARETPSVVVFSVLGMVEDKPVSEAYNRLTLDGMQMSLTKYRAIRASMTEGESMLSYLFPLLRYHDRWDKLSEEDYTYYFRSRQVSHNGYIMRVDTRPMEQLPSVPPLLDYSFADVCWEYLDKMRLLCEEKGVQFVLMKAPSVFPPWHDQWDNAISNYAKTHGLDYINFLNYFEQTGIDMQTDTYDHGMHLNLAGAEKLTRYFGGILAERYGLADRRDDAALAAVWAEKVEYYNWMRTDQFRELAEYGYLVSYGGRKP